jgi:hypothetical protein
MRLSLAAKRAMFPACTIQTVKLCSSAPLRGGLLAAQQNSRSATASLGPSEDRSAGYAAVTSKLDAPDASGGSV